MKESTKVSNRNPYLFVVGCARSGTTLLQRMLDHHPQLAVGYDPSFIPRVIKKVPVGIDPPLTPKLVEKVRGHRRFGRLGLPDTAVRKAAANARTYSEFVSAIYSEFGRLHGKALAGDKSPGYCRHLPRLYALFPWVKTIHIIRDGRDVALSTLAWAGKDKGQGKLELWQEEPLAVCALWWRRDVITGRRDGGNLAPDRYHEVRYEELVARPEKTLLRITDFLHLSYAAEMATYHVGKVRRKPGRSAKAAWLPPTPGLRNWRTEMKRRDVELFEALAGDALAELGYERRMANISREVSQVAERCRAWWEAMMAPREAKGKAAEQVLEHDAPRNDKNADEHERTDHASDALDYTDISTRDAVTSYAFVFVCQEGRLETAALLLAASLKRFLRCEHELVAVVPTPAEVMGVPDDRTLVALQELGVRIEQIDNEIVVDPRFVPERSLLEKRHLITNKMYGLKIPVNAEKRIHIDSGYVCMQEFHGDTRFSIPFNGRTVYLGGTKNYKGKWRSFYDAADAPMPSIRIRIENSSGRFNYIPPCFNSGFVAVHSELASELADHWFECWEALELGGLVRDDPYHIGQVSLAVAVAKMGLPFEMIERQTLHKHFQSFKIQRGEDKLRRKLEPQFFDLVRSLAREHPYLKQRMSQSPNWGFLIEE